MGNAIGLTVKWITNNSIETTAKRLNSAVQHSVGNSAHDACQYIKDTFLTGRALAKLTGETYDSVKVFYDKRAKSWYIKPGVGINGHLNYLFKWIGTSKEFMKPGWQEYLSLREGKMVDDVIRAIEEVM